MEVHHARVKGLVKVVENLIIIYLTHVLLLRLEWLAFREDFLVCLQFWTFFGLICVKLVLSSCPLAFTLLHHLLLILLDLVVHLKEETLLLILFRYVKETL